MVEGIRPEIDPMATDAQIDANRKNARRTMLQTALCGAAVKKADSHLVHDSHREFIHLDPVHQCGELALTGEDRPDSEGSVRVAPLVGRQGPASLRAITSSWLGGCLGPPIPVQNSLEQHFVQSPGG